MRTPEGHELVSQVTENGRGQGREIWGLARETGVIGGDPRAYGEQYLGSSSGRGPRLSFFAFLFRSD